MGWAVMLDQVVRERRPRLVGYASLFAADRASAEDLVQEALVRVFSRTRALTSVEAAEQYVRRAIRTSFLDAARKERTWRGSRHLFAVGTDVSTSPDPSSAAQAAVDVRKALARLAPRERACVVLRYVDDLSVADIATELGLSEGAVKRYLSDGTTVLRDALGDDTSVDHVIDVVPSRDEQRSTR